MTDVDSLCVQADPGVYSTVKQAGSLPPVAHKDGPAALQQLQQQLPLQVGRASRRDTDGRRGGP